MTTDATLARSPEDDAPRGNAELRSPEPTVPDHGAPQRSKVWRYYICVLLLLATTVNYIDRQALSVMSKRIKEALALSNEQYGHLELGFGLAFAAGALGFGWLADRVSVRWLYPTALVLWSVMGFLTGYVTTFAGLLVCRTLLGIFEAGHWPCALRTTQRLLPPGERTLGNSILQSGSSIGAAITPMLVLGMLGKDPEPDAWRFVFRAIGIIGLFWIVLWFTAIRARDFQTSAAGDGDAASRPDDDRQESFIDIVFSRRFAALLIVVAAINACWHLFRVWLPLFMQEGRGYDETQMQGFTTAFYIGTDVGCIVAGLATVALVRGGASVHRARVTVFTLSAMLTSLALLIPWLSAGWPLLIVLCVVGFGCLGLFPCYYSFTQDLSSVHQGKVTGLLGTFAWITAAPLHPLFGRYIDETKHYDLGLVVAGLCPIAAVAALLLLWKEPEARPVS